jgi:Zn-dependent peptidase ImmA (M78 family)
MTRNVPYLAEEAIECDAEALLAEFSHARGVDIELPIPIEDIVEKHLKLSIEFDDTHDLFGVPRSGLNLGEGPDILGAMFFDEKRIVIDESLDPDENPAKEGRYRFTLAHEGGGHWRLHRSFYTRDAAQASLFGDKSDPSVVCRSSQAKERVEWQADFYASCLLMPRSFVFAAWKEVFPDCKPRIIEPNNVIEHPFVEVKRVECWIGDMDCSETDDNLLDRIARPFAEKFLVSPIAMRIRLEKLGLLMRQVPNQRILGTG